MKTKLAKTHRHFLTKLLFILSMTTLFAPLSASAKTLVLIHGYLSNSASWHSNNTALPLHQAGWKYGGNYARTNTPNAAFQMTRMGIVTPHSSALKDNSPTYFTVDLPADAPIQLQASLLSLYLQHLYTHRNESLVLVGHSVGGLVARAWLTQQTTIPTQALITIATPHLGTPLASIASLGVKIPMMNNIGKALGLKDFKRSQAIFADLQEEQPGNYLYWLNRQTHPAISYVSVIRREKVGTNKFDFVVPRKSQNMNNVASIRGHSALLLTEGDHFLSQQDGVYIADLLKQIYLGTSE